MWVNVDVKLNYDKRFMIDLSLCMCKTVECTLSLNTHVVLIFFQYICLSSVFSRDYIRLFQNPKGFLRRTFVIAKEGHFAGQMSLLSLKPAVSTH